MEKIYGYRQDDIINLALFLKGKENQSLSKTFEEYALLSGRAKGTIRNVYYALAKLSVRDKDFRERYLNGKEICVSKINGFSREEENKLAKDVLRAKLQGKSVRKAILELADGDAKKALRYQNKFRNMMKKDNQSFNEVARELNYQPPKSKIFGMNIKAENRLILDKLIGNLKEQIDGLLERINQKLTKENALLKLKISCLQTQIFDLKRLCQKSGNLLSNTDDFFGGNNTDLLN